MSTHNIGFYEDLTKIIFDLSSNTHLISSAVKLTLLNINSYAQVKELSLSNVLAYILVHNQSFVQILNVYELCHEKACL